MGSCNCDTPTVFAATSESTGSFMYLRCNSCGGKAGRVDIDKRDLRDNVTNPDQIDETVSIRFDPMDNPFTTDTPPSTDTDTTILEKYGKRAIEDESYWVYVLDCRDRWYYESYDDLKRKAKARLDREPDWLRMAWEARRRKYVGQTENLFKRFGEHFHQRRRTEFTTLFEPRSVDYIKPANTRNSAERAEESIAKSYYDKSDVYAYWN